jgi:rod shape determining protein RodA
MFFIDRRRVHYFDWISFSIIVLLSVMSLLFVFSATYSPEKPLSIFFQKQILGIMSGFIIYFVMCAINHRSLERWGYFLFFFTMVLLVFTLFKGSVGLGAQRWINLGFIKFQPSELTKLFFPAFFGREF